MNINEVGFLFDGYTPFLTRESAMKYAETLPRLKIKGGEFDEKRITQDLGKAQASARIREDEDYLILTIIADCIHNSDGSSYDAFTKAINKIKERCEELGRLNDLVLPFELKGF